MLKGAMLRVFVVVDVAVVVAVVFSIEVKLS